jgi:hypothetical protein
MALHKSLIYGDIHIPFQWQYADATARLAATGFVASDIHRLAVQDDDHSVWLLSGYSPITWVNIGSWFTHGSRHKGDGSDPVPVATTTVAGLLSAADKVKIDAFTSGNVTKGVRNETGSPIAKGKLLYAVGWSVAEQRALVGLADKDDPAKRPALGMSIESIANNANSEALVNGLLTGVNTSAYSLTDQLVLGSAGAFSRPPPDVDPFTGEVQNIGQITRVDGSDGHVLVNIDGLSPVTATQIFALAGSYGTPSKTNRYVTETDPLYLIGQGYTSALSDPEQTTTSSTWQDALSIVTPAVNGTYIVYAIVGNRSAATNKFCDTRLYDATGATELYYSNRYGNNWEPTIFIGTVTVTGGAARTLKIQFCSPDNNTTVYVRRLRMFLWRVA